MKNSVLLLFVLGFCVASCCQVRAAGKELWGWWNFDEGSGDTVKDISGKGNDGTIHDARWITGVSNSALSFRGENDYVEVPHSDSIDIGGENDDYSIEFWFKSSKRPAPDAHFLGKVGNTYPFTFDQLAGGEIHFRNWDGSSMAGIVSANLTDGKWHHILGVRDGDNRKLYLYVDGIQAGEASDSTKGDLNNNSPIKIGRSWGDDFNGDLDEVKIYAYAVSAKKEGKEIKVAPIQYPGLSMEVVPYPLVKKTAVVKLGASKKEFGSLKPTDLKAKVELVSPEGKILKTGQIKEFDAKYRVETELGIADLPAGEYEIKASLIDKKDKVLTEASSKLGIAVYPWIGSKAGITDEVFAPWTPMEIDGQKVKCWGRTYDFSGSFLPSAVINQGSSILSGPITLETVIDKKPVALSGQSLAVVTKSPSKVIMKASGKYGALDVSADVLIEYDGMIRIDLTLSPKEKLSIDKLALLVPIKKEFAALFNYWPAFNGQPKNTGELKNNMAMQFAPFFWLGNEDLGFGWFAESDKGWNNRNENSVIRAEMGEDMVTMRISIISTPLQADSPLTYTFGFQGTPVKKYPEGWRYWRIAHGANYGIEKPPAATPNNTAPLSQLAKLKKDGVNTIVFHEHWTDIQNYPGEMHAEELKSLVSECHRLGMKLLVYFGYELSNIAPEWNLCRDEVLCKDAGGGKKGGYTRKPTQVDYIVCYNSIWQDFIVQGVQDIIDKYHIDGVYLDGTVEPWDCANAAHGCGYVKDGKVKTTYPIFAVRSIMKRLNAVCTKNGGFVDAHNSTCVIAPTISFATSLWDGEWMQARLAQCKTKSEILEVFPLGAFRAEFMGTNWGIPTQFLVYPGGKWSLEAALSITLLHDIACRPSPTSVVTKVWKAQENFGVGEKDCAWLPYWKNEGYITCPEGVKASIYSRNEKGALIVVSNLTDSTMDAVIKLDPLKLKLKKGFEVSNALTGDAIPLAGQEFTINLRAFAWKLLLVK
ncbi:hypothetical protein COY52_05180 [Candidatus Desantisbacteria bacterium CG_4_10_14_0_8_um_filter_48_22]|uniref:Laminin G domain-containing protein n=1 Tax=Candidatus Desantisbacteria bacterium CG_4_10_14_0_8_um_filter_48_22 TaxID=1974543 RepID=A0A2M7SCE9_9BACT|nr:MAG: hypothetical protein AUJ67_02080 [Candidatus Desantisbacteria bacterium CG1_02_49_89]PIV55156.1 MAG: hypothetical protein COS16_08095 [Candidatus Desantisbacteria bacterium CG02_land_8_20_14_3_00_49_13]PIZ17149.1 MAG: hypothetical protein COY52_05180 [Candidatus Desantisbacteria bacterium CG_4_10_14_0_8_um_filter_48_22]PJB27716.1 MAG: hypothetical protein CO111_03740 [Candidatus Desantisbacteria bacterium CG_4_9_14_3_um_filter_50_7]